MLLDLDDLLADEPIRVDHRRVDRPRDARARLVEDAGDPLVEVFLLCFLEIAHAADRMETTSPTSLELGIWRRIAPLIPSLAALYATVVADTKGRADRRTRRNMAHEDGKRRPVPKSADPSRSKRVSLRRNGAPHEPKQTPPSIPQTSSHQVTVRNAASHQLSEILQTLRKSNAPTGLTR